MTRGGDDGGEEDENGASTSTAPGRIEDQSRDHVAPRRRSPRGPIDVGLGARDARG